jgi:hypothetical protein
MRRKKSELAVAPPNPAAREERKRGEVKGSIYAPLYKADDSICTGAKH